MKEIEIILINDGSTDQLTNRILDQYSKKDKRIKLINKRNTGYGDTMNIGIENASGEYIGLVESDDYITNDMYLLLYNIAKKYNLDIAKANIFRFLFAWF